jgi:hypothetical protein
MSPNPRRRHRLNTAHILDALDDHETRGRIAELIARLIDSDGDIYYEPASEYAEAEESLATAAEQHAEAMQELAAILTGGNTE